LVHDGAVGRVLDAEFDVARHWRDQVAQLAGFTRVGRSGEREEGAQSGGRPARAKSPYFSSVCLIHWGVELSMGASSMVNHK
jgi:hypothetical protein